MQKWQRHFFSIILAVIIIPGSSTSFYAQTVNQPASVQGQGLASQTAPGQTLSRQEKFRKVRKAILNHYIVVLNDESIEQSLTPDKQSNSTAKQRAEIIGQRIDSMVTEMARTHSGAIKHVYKDALKGFSAQMTESEAIALSLDPRVKYVEEDGLSVAQNTDPNPPWGLDRIDQRDLPLTNNYTYQSTGDGVNVYVIDSGIRTTHQEFEGRAVVAGDFVTGSNQGGQDCNGHGTHVAGTIGGKLSGVAKKVNIFSVRVLGIDENEQLACGAAGRYGRNKDIIAGINWVTRNHANPAVVNFSIGGELSTALDDAVKGCIASGVTFVVAAGNDNIDASNVSPAQVAEAITVGATNRSDTRPTNWGDGTRPCGFRCGSNYGPAVDLFAPGESILSAGITDDTESRFMSGTSMAAPHVTGVVARYLQFAPSASPAVVQAAIKTEATMGKIIDPGQGSPNRLLYSAFLVGIYLDQANTSGQEDGSSQFPFRTFGASVNAVGSGGVIIIRPGMYSAPGTYTKPMTLVAPNGNVILK